MTFTTSWTKGLTKEQSAEMKKEFVSAALLRKRLSEILDDKRDASRNASIQKAAYELPGWAFMQADAIGYERALKEIFDLLV